jgi:hypothetical protein
MSTLVGCSGYPEPASNFATEKLLASIVVAVAALIQVNRYSRGTNTMPITLGQGRAVLQIIKHNAAEGIFEPEDLRVLATAFDEAWNPLEKSGVRFQTDFQRHQVRNTLGKCLIEEAKRGERDKGRLRDSALLLYCQSALR